MPAKRENDDSTGLQLLCCYFQTKDKDGPDKDVIMLCEMVGDEIQSISIRSAADAMTRYGKLN